MFINFVGAVQALRSDDEAPVRGPLWSADSVRQLGDRQGGTDEHQRQHAIPAVDTTRRSEAHWSPHHPDTIATARDVIRPSTCIISDDKYLVVDAVHMFIFYVLQQLLP